MCVQVHPGDNVAAGKDHTLYALQAGIVVFKKNKYKKQVLRLGFLLPCVQRSSALYLGIKFQHSAATVADTSGSIIDTIWSCIAAQLIARCVFTGQRSECGRL